MKEPLTASAAMTIRQLRPLNGMDLGYNRESVEWLEGYIKRRRQSGQLDSGDVQRRDDNSGEPPAEASRLPCTATRQMKGRR